MISQHVFSLTSCSYSYSEANSSDDDDSDDDYKFETTFKKFNKK